MRTLVEQTRDCISAWLEALAGRYGDGSPELRWLADNSPTILMGGEEPDSSWDLYLEKEAILIGTQDMLLSRALNRGYGMTRYRWPIHFGLLNNDALWVMDETQLMGVAVETSAQLDAFRSAAVMCPTWWMSATLDQTQLATVDHPKPAGGWPWISLEEADRQAPSVQDREGARKILRQAGSKLAADKKDEIAAYATTLAEEVVAAHRQGTLTLVVINRVNRAHAVFRALEKRVPQQTKALIHSRFRPVDRAAQQKILFAPGDRIVVATQAVEAGIDVSARTLFTELAPCSSLVQRFGRTNRSGEVAEGTDVFWIELAVGDEKLATPYLPEELRLAREVLERVTDVGPATLATQMVEPMRPVRPVLRRKDLFDLFDTTPDLAGNDLDISRYVRDGEPSDVQVFWRELEKDARPYSKLTGAPTREELCAVSLFEFEKFLESERKRAKEKQRDSRIWTWNGLDDEWQPAHRAVPGRIYLIATDAGGYSTQYGWTGETQQQPPALQSGGFPEPGYDGDWRTTIGVWLSLAEHTSDVLAAVTDLSSTLQIDKPTLRILQIAAFWHDVGKAHEIFQKMLRKIPGCPETTTYWAKSGRSGGKSERPRFRHELASALAWLQSDDAMQLDEMEQSLVAYLIASHHGKVRASLRAFPDEKAPPEDDRLFARGVWHGDPLPAPDNMPIVIEGRELPRIDALDLRCMLLGGTEGRPSWLSRVLALRNNKEIGPFRLAWLEAIFRAADVRASAAAERRGTGLPEPLLAGS
ncbi:MAG: cas3 [Chthoniobacteraceae bacterium]|nr:cas3 [Chthoniobacteraceae bacterium]